MDKKGHWEQVYSAKAPDAVSWYIPHLETSLSLIRQAVSNQNATIIDVGGGEATLVDDLIAEGYEFVSETDTEVAAHLIHYYYMLV